MEEKRRKPNLDRVNEQFRELEKSGYSPEAVERTTRDSLDSRREGSEETQKDCIVRRIAVMAVGSRFRLFNVDGKE
jgi:hypothetical protein